ncbi:MAG: hypothetical protein PHZ03_01015 [Syntrophomonas sp.]|nr:hypothetical protein [Syntrophomonas sp.]
MKCDLNSVELEDMHLLFGKINQARMEIKAGITAQEDYTESINEINCLSSEDSEYGEELCRKALEQLAMIRAAELAQINIHNYQAELESKYEIPGSRSEGGAAAYG